MGRPQTGTVLAGAALVMAAIVGAATVPLNTAKADLASYAGLQVPRAWLLGTAVIVFLVSAAHLIHRWLRWRDERLSFEDAGRWLYTYGGSALREACKRYSPQFGIAGYGTEWMRHVAEEENLPVYGRREAGLPIERLEPELWRITGYKPPVPAVDLSIRRRELWRLRKRGLR